jgi:hypothetical protein
MSTKVWFSKFRNDSGAYDLLAAYDGAVAELTAAEPGERPLDVDPHGIVNVRALLAAVVDQIGEVREYDLARAILKRIGVDSLASYSAAVRYGHEAAEHPEKFRATVREAQRQDALASVLASIGAHDMAQA